MTARPIGTPKIPVASEHEEQALLVEWSHYAAGRHPELRLLFAIPNFSGRLGKVPPVAARRQAARLNAEGRKSGVPDLCLPVARQGHHGLFLEMKRLDGGRVTPEQAQWHNALRAEGYRVVVARGWEEGRDALLDYLRPAGTP
jgi:hypothetical protein